MAFTDNQRRLSAWYWKHNKNLSFRSDQDQGVSWAGCPIRDRQQHWPPDSACADLCVYEGWSSLVSTIDLYTQCLEQVIGANPAPNPASSWAIIKKYCCVVFLVFFNAALYGLVKQASPSGWSHSETSGIFYIHESFSNVERPWEARVERRWGSTARELIWGQSSLTGASTATEQQGAPDPVSCCQQAAASKQWFSSPLNRERPTWTITSLTPLVFTLIVCYLLQ